MDYKADIGQVQHRSTEPVYCAYPTKRRATEMLGTLPLPSKSDHGILDVIQIPIDILAGPQPERIAFGYFPVDSIPDGPPGVPLFRSYDLSFLPV